MTFHLTDLEVVDALDGRLALPRQPHLRGCAMCQAAVAEARTVLTALESADASPVPEPPAEFWTQLSADIHTRVATEALPQSTPWWQGSSRGWGLLAAAAALLLAVWLPGSRTPSAPVVPNDAPLVATVSIDDVRWQLMADMLAELPDEDVVAVLAPSSLAMDASVGALSTEERETFRRLLENGLNPGSN